jgi:hypothetical protein
MHQNLPDDVQDEIQELTEKYSEKLDVDSLLREEVDNHDPLSFEDGQICLENGLEVNMAAFTPEKLAQMEAIHGMDPQTFISETMESVAQNYQNLEQRE